MKTTLFTLLLSVITGLAEITIRDNGVYDGETFLGTHFADCEKNYPAKQSDFNFARTACRIENSGNGIPSGCVRCVLATLPLQTSFQHQYRIEFQSWWSQLSLEKR